MSPDESRDREEERPHKGPDDLSEPPIDEPHDEDDDDLDDFDDEDDEFEDEDDPDAVPPMKSEDCRKTRLHTANLLVTCTSGIKTSPICNLFLIEMVSFFGLGPSTRMRDP